MLAYFAHCQDAVFTGDEQKLQDKYVSFRYSFYHHTLFVLPTPNLLIYTSHFTYFRNLTRTGQGRGTSRGGGMGSSGQRPPRNTNSQSSGLARAVFNRSQSTSRRHSQSPASNLRSGSRASSQSARDPFSDRNRWSSGSSRPTSNPFADPHRNSNTSSSRRDSIGSSNRPSSGSYQQDQFRGRAPAGSGSARQSLATSSGQRSSISLPPQGRSAQSRRRSVSVQAGSSGRDHHNAGLEHLADRGRQDSNMRAALATGPWQPPETRQQAQRQSQPRDRRPRISRIFRRRQ